MQQDKIETSLLNVKFRSQSHLRIWASLIHVFSHDRVNWDLTYPPLRQKKKQKKPLENLKKYKLFSHLEQQGRPEKREKMGGALWLPHLCACRYFLKSGDERVKLSGDCLTKLRWQISDLGEAKSLEIWTEEKPARKGSRERAPENCKSYHRVNRGILSGYIE